MKTSSSRGSGSGNSARQGPGLSEPQITTTRCPRAGLQLQRGEEEGCRGWAPSEWRWGLRKAGRVYFKQAPIAGTLTQCIPNSQTLNPKATILTLHPERHRSCCCCSTTPVGSATPLVHRKDESGSFQVSSFPHPKDPLRDLYAVFMAVRFRLKLSVYDCFVFNLVFRISSGLWVWI